ncbi:MAG: MarR family transcriptional regulator [Acidobacteria bacterium]|nr:MAG: MarR family transcriptional regulator [Acidobacteriota bacterium]
MSRAISKRINRRELLKKFTDLGRRTSTQTVFLHQAIAQGIGLNATDTKCVDLILTHPAGSMTAGQLSDMTGLTSGAITHILDRLEKRHIVERVRDTQDRRRIFVRVNLKSLEPLMPQYDAIGKAYVDLVDQYSDRELQLICDYMEKVAAVATELLANVSAANRR